MRIKYKRPHEYVVPTMATLGITNHTEDNYFLPFFDYDNTEWSVVKEDIDFFQKNYGIGPAIVNISSEKRMYSGKLVANFHVIAFTKHNFKEMREIIDIARCDDRFKQGWKYQQRCWVLRILSKSALQKGRHLVKRLPVVVPAVKFFKLVLPPKNVISYTPVSRSMVEFFEKCFALKLQRHFKYMDNSKQVEVITYTT